MFSCPQCSKTYRTQNSLRRHLHNHSVHTSGHRCPTCDLAFPRRDVMLRHMEIHEDAPRLSRRRCHTACESCRNSHEKCNGENPCNICTNRKHKCEYTQKSRRISQPVSSTSARIEGGNGQVEKDTEPPQENQEIEETAQERTSPRDSPASGIGNPTFLPSESDFFIESTEQQGSVVPNDMQCENYSIAPNTQTSSNFLDTIVSALPEKVIEDETMSQVDHGFQVESTQQQGSLASGDMGCEGYTSELDTQISSDYLDSILSNLPETVPEDGTLPQVDRGFQVATQVQANSKTALQLGADDVFCPLTEPDLFSFTFDPFDSVSHTGIPKSTVRRDDDLFIFQEEQQPLWPLPPDEWQQTLALTASPYREGETGGAGTTSNSESGIIYRSKQQGLVEELVAYAIAASDTLSSERRCYWDFVSNEVCRVFKLSKPNEGGDCILIQMVHLYRKNLLPLWPMICERSLEDPVSLHPVLFLVAVSAGAMYLDQNASVFGTALHKRLRASLITGFIENDIPEPDTIWLIQARTTIQVVSLYFGEELELTLAQHLGGVLASQARRMNLFRRTEMEDSLVGGTPEERLAAWIWAETRRRVAFGMFRADVFLSILTNSPPTISADELRIPLPYPDFLWLHIGKKSPREILAALERERTKRDETLFCDLIRIMLDRHEVLSHMGTRDYELLLFGLQEQVWKFSHDPEMFQRLTGHHLQHEQHTESPDMEMHQGLKGSVTHIQDHLQVSHREMSDLALDRRRLFKALEKWSQSFNASRFRPGLTKDRGSILNSLLLFHMYHLQLNASLNALHHIADRVCNKMTIDYKRLQTAISWAQTAQARHASHHASKIRLLLDNEAKMNPMKEARYTMLSFIGLYHASIVLWTYLGASRDSKHSLFATGTDNSDGDYSGKSPEILQSIVVLYPKLKCMSWDAFVERIRRLSWYQFPQHGS